MKKHSNCSSKQMNTQHPEDLKNLVHETLAAGTTPRHKTFTAAELWSIQEHSKRRIQRRFDF